MSVSWRDPRVGWLIVLGTPLVLVATLAGACAIVWSVNARPLAFERGHWAADVRGARDQLGPHTTRQRMLDDLMARHLRAGMRRSELEALLGAPDVERGDALLVWRVGGAIDDDLQCLDVLLNPSGERVAGWNLAQRWLP